LCFVYKARSPHCYVRKRHRVRPPLGSWKEGLEVPFSVRSLDLGLRSCFDLFPLAFILRPPGVFPSVMRFLLPGSPGVFDVRLGSLVS